MRRSAPPRTARASSSSPPRTILAAPTETGLAPAGAKVRAVPVVPHSAAARRTYPRNRHVGAAVVGRGGCCPDMGVSAPETPNLVILRSGTVARVHERKIRAVCAGLGGDAVGGRRKGAADQ